MEILDSRESSEVWRQDVNSSADDRSNSFYQHPQDILPDETREEADHISSFKYYLRGKCGIVISIPRHQLRRLVRAIPPFVPGDHVVGMADSGHTIDELREKYYQAMYKEQAKIILDMHGFWSLLKITRIKGLAFRMLILVVLIGLAYPFLPEAWQLGLVEAISNRKLAFAIAIGGFFLAYWMFSSGFSDEYDD